MLVAKARFKPTGQWQVGQQRIEIDGCLRDAHAMALGRDRRMQVGQRLAVIEPAAFRHEAVEQGEHALGAVDKGAHDFVGIYPGLIAPLVEPRLGAGCFLGRRQIEKGKEVARYEMNLLLFELGLALGVDQARGGIGKLAFGIGRGGVPLRLDEEAPTRTEATDGIVDARGRRDQFGRDGGFEIRPAEFGGSLKAAILVQHHARRDERNPWQVVGKAAGAAAIFGKVDHDRALKRPGELGGADAGGQLPRTADRPWRPTPP